MTRDEAEREVAEELGFTVTVDGLISPLQLHPRKAIAALWNLAVTLQQRIAELEAQNTQAIQAFAREVAEKIRTYPVIHGDHYAAYAAPSDDAEKLAHLIEEAAGIKEG